VPGGAAWLRALPDLVAGCARDWALTLGPPFEPASVSWVAPARLPDGTAAVLKVNFPDEESAHEADALAWWAGDGAVGLFASDAARRALLVERCLPGTPLWGVADEDAANDVAAGVLCRLWRPAPDGAPFRTLAEEAARWARDLPRRWARYGRPVPRRLLDQGVGLCADLAAAPPDAVVCHQDLHGGNVLSAGGDRWLAIDPKPLVGERAFDVASLLRDRRRALLAAPTPLAVVRRRLDLLAGELGLDRARARGWGIIHALAWGMADDAVYPEIVACAELVAAA
jgi:streptomycin 6-kinase